MFKQWQYFIAGSQVYMFKEYPKKVILKDGTEVILNLCTTADKKRLLEFFTSLPREDRMFLKADVTDLTFIDNWVHAIDNQTKIAVIAEKDGKIIAQANLRQEWYGWMRHVGEIRVIVAHEHQRKGLGTILTREMFNQSLKRGLDKLEAFVMDNQIAAIKAFKRAGFRKEAELKDHVMDLDGKKRNLIIMTNNVRRLMRKINDLIREHELQIEDQTPQ